jgi:acetyltransferase
VSTFASIAATTAPVAAAAAPTMPTAARAPAASEPPFRIHRYPSALIHPVMLADGRSVIVRPVLPQDAEAEQAFFGALSPASRRRRFHGVVNRLPDGALRAMTSIDYQRHVALVAEARCDDGAFGPTWLVADARYVVDDDGVAEFALAVADDWQGQGLGRAMLERLGRHARARGLRRLDGTVLSDNEPMRVLLGRLGAAVHPDPRDASVVHVRWTV